MFIFHPELLLQLSEVIARVQQYFQQITGQKKMIFGNVSPEEFQKQLDKRFHVETNNPEIKKFLQQIDYDQAGTMNLFSWNGLVDMQCLCNETFMVPNLKSGKMEPITRALSVEEQEMLKNMMRRVHTIAKMGMERNVRIFVDAEQTYFQPAINRITMELMRKYNKEQAIIFNTYQCYLKVSTTFLNIYGFLLTIIFSYFRAQMTLVKSMLNYQEDKIFILVLNLFVEHI